MHSLQPIGRLVACHFLSAKAIGIYVLKTALALGGPERLPRFPFCRVISPFEWNRTRPSHSPRRASTLTDHSKGAQSFRHQLSRCYMTLPGPHIAALRDISATAAPSREFQVIQKLGTTKRSNKFCFIDDSSCNRFDQYQYLHSSGKRR
jgi:hypothetical protein